MNKASVKFIKKVDLSSEEIKKEFEGVFMPGERVVVKTHFGEPGNVWAFTPEMVEPYITALRELGLETVLWDCPVLYESPRDSKEKYEKVVRDKGFYEISPCEICDEYDKVRLSDGAEAEVAKIMTGAKNLLVLTHVKGHGMAGFGGSIKNVGIGAMSPKTKAYVHEDRFSDGDWGFSQDRLGEVVGAAVSVMPSNRFFVNVMRNVAQHCDCDETADNPIIAPDAGVLFSDNIVAIDQASLDIMNGIKKGVFVEATGVEPQEHIDATAKYSGLSREYDLK